jgi:hypothetical protein
MGELGVHQVLAGVVLPSLFEAHAGEGFFGNCNLAHRNNWNNFFDHVEKFKLQKQFAFTLATPVNYSSS